MANPNEGVVLLNPAPCPSKRTLIVSGLARSGTSMVAAMLEQGGVYLGSALDSAVREDLEISTMAGVAASDPAKLASTPKSLL